MFLFYLIYICSNKKHATSKNGSKRINRPTIKQRYSQTNQMKLNTSKKTGKSQNKSPLRKNDVIGNNPKNNKRTKEKFLNSNVDLISQTYLEPINEYKPIINEESDDETSLIDKTVTKDDIQPSFDHNNIIQINDEGKSQFLKIIKEDTPKRKSNDLFTENKVTPEPVEIELGEGFPMQFDEYELAVDMFEYFHKMNRPCYSSRFFILKLINFFVDLRKYQ
ncbi:hypothetical protein TRFO_36164 [Tritrichomonas foetus]|uniref:Uncharacterized protein n=1 Tax=Tritrichomonas foetus TaxID=1144522 RepID=A0A1J4JJ31_9EUKA|nr:hypothetical protein TRFO_36164 [Tritrichomonas foetus]|eukprot:OHS97563.1 hypothetical protein TRFO_36164 [Tritrichomonas foetus]